jgi:hypothetical protein
MDKREREIRDGQQVTPTSTLGEAVHGSINYLLFLLDKEREKVAGLERAIQMTSEAVSRRAALESEETT